MNRDSFEYIGAELDLFAEAENWRAYWASLVAPFIGQDVLEIGAGIGSVTQHLRQAEQQWTALEPDPELAVRIRSLDNSTSLNVVVGSIDALAEGPTFDTVLYIDVLEHIEDDETELHKALMRLRRGGNLVVLVPAHQWLFSNFDASIGHFRRYTRNQLRTLKPKGACEVWSGYVDSAGVLASTANRILLRSSMPTRRQIRTWDAVLVPISRTLDRHFRHTLGKSLIMVWRKET